MPGAADELASLDFLIAEERERFRLTDERVKAQDAQAATITAGGVALGALVAAVLSGTEPTGVEAAFLILGGLLLVAAMGLGVLARHDPQRGASPRPKPGGDGEAVLLDVVERLEAAAEKEWWENIAPGGDPRELRELALRLWRARIDRAWMEAELKAGKVNTGLEFLYSSIVLFSVAAYALFT